MKSTEKELAARMKKRLASERGRQRKWRLRQKEKGLKPVAGMVSGEAFAILKKEKQKTGETVSRILEKALLNLSTSMEPVASPPLPAAAGTEENPKQEMDFEQRKADVHAKIKKMRTEDNLPFNEIARFFNEEGLETLSGEPEWDGKSIYTIFKEIDTK